MGTGDEGRVIGAVICGNEDINKLRWVILSADAVNKLANDFSFVPGRDQNGVTVYFNRAVGPVFSKQRDRNIKKLVRIADEKQAHDYKVY